LYRILSGALYVGEIQHRTRRYEGQQPAIVECKLYDAVQALLAAQARKKADGSSTNGASALLAGLVGDGAGSRLVSTHTAKGTKRYRYYATPALTADQPPLRVPALALEKLVVDSVVARLSTAELLAPDLIDSPDLPAALATAAMLGTNLRRADAAARRELLLNLVEKVMVTGAAVTISIRLAPIAEVNGGTLAIVVPAEIGRRKASLSLVVPGQAQVSPDPALIALVARSRSWFEDLRHGRVATIRELAAREGLGDIHVRPILPFAFLAPDIVTAIAEGRQPATLTAAKLKAMAPLPTSWAEQRLALGWGA